MDIVKEIINCETNKKFIKVHDDGRIEIPDVVGCYQGDVYPLIAGEVDNEDCSLLGFLEGDNGSSSFSK